MYLCGHFEQAERLAEELLERTALPIRKVEVLEQLILAHTTQLHYRQAIETAVRALALLGESIPGRPTQLHVVVELARTKLALAGKTPDKMLAIMRQDTPVGKTVSAMTRNGWVHLALLDPDSQAIWTYRDGAFREYAPRASQLPTAASSLSV